MLSIEHYPEPSAAGAHSIRACPRCLSIEIESVTPIANVSLRDAAETVWADCWAGRGAQAGRFLLRYLCVKAANVLRDKYICRHCGHSFGERQS